MKNSARRSPVAIQEAMSRHERGRSQKSSKPAKIYGSARKTVKSAAIVPSEPNFRITPAAQLEIIRLCMQGCSLCEIARITHRARQTVAKIVRAPEVQAKIEELKGKLLGSSDKWIESVNYAVDTELDGRLGYDLLKDFQVIPPRAEYVQSPLQSGHQPLDPERLARARAIGMIALERGSSPPLEANELEKLARK